MIFFNASKYVIGVDEAGRGPIAGPVVAAACTLNVRDENILSFVRDSKKLTAKQRLFARSGLEKICNFAIGLASVEEIEKLNILNATMLAMNRAIDGLISGFQNLEYDIIVDGNRAPRPSAVTLVRGDDTYFEIAAASIFAKTSRDKIMCDAALKYPGYGFEKHFGYGTKLHYDSIKRLGMCDIHRKTWIKLPL